MAKFVSLAVLCCSVSAMGAATGFPEPENPASGIWIQQVGNIAPHASTKATLYYTKYANYKTDAVKSLEYYYDGAGYLQLLNKKSLCGKDNGMDGADGIIHHPNGDLVVAAQGTSVHLIDKEGGSRCVERTTTTSYGHGVWHLMLDPNHRWLWAAGIPGQLHRIDLQNASGQLDTLGKSYEITLTNDASNRVKNDLITTVIWDDEGNAFYTYSDYYGGGCEMNNKNEACSEDAKAKARAKAHFGYISDTIWTKITDSNSKNNLCKTCTIGKDSVITQLTKKILIDSLEGAHGGTYDPYSKTIFVFGGARIVQIRPYKSGGQMKAEVIAYIDLREFFFDESTTNLTGPRTSGVGWRLDQGTVDGYGHLFVASSTGHLLFIDYAANKDKKIDNNVLVHLQWIDDYLDDVAPLSGVGVIRSGASTGTDYEFSSNSYGFSSSRVVYQGSSSSKPTSSGSTSSNSNGNSSAGGSGNSSGGGNGTSSAGGSGTSSIGGNPGSSAGGGSGTSSAGGSGTSSIGGNPGSSAGGGSGTSSAGGSGTSSIGGNPGSSAGGGSGTSSAGGSTNSSAGGSGSGTSSAGGSNPGSSNSNAGYSSSNKGGGFDIDDQSSSSNKYSGFVDFGDDDDSGLDFYPSTEKYDQGDSVVGEVVILLPVDSASGTPGTVTIGENVYLIDNKVDNVKPMSFDYNGNVPDSARVGELVAIRLDSSKVAQYFGDSVSSLTFATSTDGLTLIDPENPVPGDTIRVAADGSITVWVTADEIVHGGSIVVVGDKGGAVIIDNINFYDPIPEADKGYIKDSDDDALLDYVEIMLKDSLPSDIKIRQISIVVNGDTIVVPSVPDVVGKKVMVSDVPGSKLPEKFPEDAFAIITYVDANDVVYYRNASLVELGSQIIDGAYAIRNLKGKDSLFVKFNVDLIPADITDPDMIIMLKQGAKRFGFDLDQVSNIYMPSKNLLIFVGDSLGLKGDLKDSVSLYPSVSFHNLEYITADEFEREVPVTVIDRVPKVVDVEYWDTDGDGNLDQIVTNFSKKLTREELDMIYIAFPWYSSRGMVVQLQAKSSSLRLDTADASKVIWDVYSIDPLISRVTGISDELPLATVYTYYDVMGETFITEDNAPLVDKMSPVIVGAQLDYGKKADTLRVTFSEAILYQDLKGRDFFSYIHGQDTLDLLPKEIIWSKDGKVATLIIDGNLSTILPGDSLMVVKGEKSVVKDNFGNIAGEKPSPVVISGLLNHLVESTKMGTFDVDGENGDGVAYKTLSSVNLRYVPNSTTKEDLEKEGSLGQLVQLGERFVPQLLDAAQVSADGSFDPSVLDSLNPKNVYISFVVNYFDHLGQYVNDTTITVSCADFKFGGNCLNTDKKVFVNWNFKDANGRFVGNGVYMVNFKLVVRYEKKKIQEEMKDKWGVRRKKHSKK